jgi:GTP-binding protein EngB required for normal cell division
VLLDGRHGPTKLDVEAIKFLSFESVPVTFVFTKVDQIKNQSERARRKKEASQALRDLGYDPDNAHWVSAETGLGIRELAGELGLG